MSHMVYCYHIAITSGDKATTRSRSTGRVPRCPVSRCPLVPITLRDPTDTNCRNGRIRKSHVRLLLNTGRSHSGDFGLLLTSQ
jgi:hypothetical protein